MRALMWHPFLATGAWERNLMHAVLAVGLSSGHSYEVLTSEITGTRLIKYYSD